MDLVLILSNFCVLLFMGALFCIFFHVLLQGQQKPTSPSSLVMFSLVTLLPLTLDCSWTSHVLISLLVQFWQHLSKAIEIVLQSHSCLSVAALPYTRQSTLKQSKISFHSRNPPASPEWSFTMAFCPSPKSHSTVMLQLMSPEKRYLYSNGLKHSGKYEFTGMMSNKELVLSWHSKQCHC